MKKIMQVLGLVLLTAGIVVAAAGSDYKNNETCDNEWTKFQSAVSSQLPIGIGMAADSPRSESIGHSVK